MAQNDPLYIYESPDQGKTVYRRLPGSPFKELIQEDVDAKHILERKLTWSAMCAKCLDDPELEELMNRAEVYYRLKYAED